MDEAAAGDGLAIVQCLLQRVEHEAGVRRPRHAPADDAAGVGVDDERDVDEAGPRRDVGEVRDPQHVRPWCPEPAIDVIERTGRGLVAHRRAHPPAADHPLQSHFLHQARHRAAGHVVPFPQQLPPDLAHAVDLEVLIENPFDLDAEHGVALDTRRCRLRLGAAGDVGVVCRRGDRQNTLQIGSTPWSSRYASTKLIMASIGGRAPPGQNTRWPCAGSRWPGAARGSPAPAP